MLLWGHSITSGVPTKRAKPKSNQKNPHWRTFFKISSLCFSKMWMLCILDLRLKRHVSYIAKSNKVCCRFSGGVLMLTSWCLLIIVLKLCKVMSLVGRNTHKYWEAKWHHLCNLLSNGSEKEWSKQGRCYHLGIQETGAWKCFCSVFVSLSLSK